MTIRRNVDITDINHDYMYFETAIENRTKDTDERMVDMLRIIGNACDQLLSEMQLIGLSTCNCDGIREIECLMFDMLRKNNPDSEIEKTIKDGIRIEEELDELWIRDNTNHFDEEGEQ